ncbi:MAG: transposase [Thermoguttaceae bacterium]
MAQHLTPCYLPASTYAAHERKWHLSRRRAFAAHDRNLREAVDAMAANRDEQLDHKNLHPACRKTLQSLSEHWAGLTLFVEHPDVPMDNNRTERTQRWIWAARKGAEEYGS